jgi:hypothetical protein
MTTGIPDGVMNHLLKGAGLMSGGHVTRRRWPRFEARGEVRFTRPMEKTENVGELADVSRGGLAFLTTASLAVGETLHLSWDEEGRARRAEAAVEAIHSHPKDPRVLVGARFVR